MVKMTLITMIAEKVAHLEVNAIHDNLDKSITSSPSLSIRYCLKEAMANHERLFMNMAIELTRLTILIIMMHGIVSKYHSNTIPIVANEVIVERIILLNKMAYMG